MTEGFARSPAPASQSGRVQPANLADVLERVLDKGIVIAGDIRVNLLDIELLTIKIRLLVASVDKAAEMGIDWWRTDPMLNSRAADDVAKENERLRRRLEELEGSSSRAIGSDDDDVDDSDRDRTDQGTEAASTSKERERG